MPRYQDRKPNFPPSYTVHISPAKEADHGDSDRDSQGFGLRRLLAQIYAINPIRPLSPAGARQQSALRYRNQSTGTRKYRERQCSHSPGNSGVLWSDRRARGTLVGRLCRHGSQREAPSASGQDRRRSWFFRIQFLQCPISTSARNDRSGRPHEREKTNQRHPRHIARRHAGRFLSRRWRAPWTVRWSMKPHAGVYEFNLKTTEGSENGFLDRLRDQFNLSIAPAQRRVEVVVLKPAE